MIADYYSVGVAPWLLAGVLAAILGWPAIRKLWDRPTERDRLMRDWQRTVDRLTRIAFQDEITPADMTKFQWLASRAKRLQEQVHRIDETDRLGPPPWPRGR